MISCLTSEQIALQDPDVCVQGVWGQEGTVPRPFSQLHPLCPLPGHGLYHLRVHEAGPPPELVIVFIPTKSKPVCSESSNRSNRETEYQTARNSLSVLFHSLWLPVWLSASNERICSRRVAWIWISSVFQRIQRGSGTYGLGGWGNDMVFNNVGKPATILWYY